VPWDQSRSVHVAVLPTGTVNVERVAVIVGRAYVEAAKAGAANTMDNPRAPATANRRRVSGPPLVFVIGRGRRGMTLDRREGDDERGVIAAAFS
jgi:hypothetical protein